MRFKLWIVAYTLIFTLTGCGSGREDFASQDPSTEAVSVNTFNIRAGWQWLVKNGFSKSFGIRGSCLGNLEVSQGPAQPYADGIYSLTNTSLMGTLFTYCAPGVILPTPTNTTMAHYYNATYENTYFVSGDTSGAWDTNPSGYAEFPIAVKVGDEGTIGTVVLYDATGLVSGEEVWTYTIKANTATTVIFQLTKTTTDASNPAKWVKTQDERYKVSAQGTLELQAIEWSQADGLYVDAK